MSLNINISRNEIETVLNRFYDATGIHVYVYNLGLDLLAEYPKCSTDFSCKDFCRKLNLLSSITHYKCLNCMFKAIDEVCLSRTSCITDCHLNFKVAFVPIIMYNEVVSIVKIGPIRSSFADKYEFERIMSWITDSDNFTKEDIGNLKSSYFEIIASEDKQIEAATFLMTLCVQHICSNQWFICEERRLIDDFEAYVNNNIYKDISIADVSVALKISRSHLSRIIQAKKNLTFTDYVLNKKVDEAKKLLLTTSMSVKEISEVLSFNDPTYFMKVFRNKTGYTCTTYRKRFVF